MYANYAIIITIGWYMQIDYRIKIMIGLYIKMDYGTMVMVGQCMPMNYEMIVMIGYWKCKYITELWSWLVDMSSECDTLR